VDLIGKRLGNHRIVSRIGKGGMGEVYLAENPKIDRRAAIKVLHARAEADPDTVKQFFDEARAANRVHHQGIVDIYDYGHDPEVGPYLVMEYLEGRSLGQRIRRDGALPVEDAVSILGDVASVLEAVHRHGLVHRDLKPDNVFLASDGRVKVLDFGVAMLATRMRDDETGLFYVMGTPQYMSPEQCSVSADIDHRTDVYALGVIAYEMLTGLVPFDNRDHRKVLLMHQSEPPPPLTALDYRAPEELEPVVLRALAKEPSERYSSVWEFAVALADAAGMRLPQPDHQPRPTHPVVPPLQDPAQAPLALLRDCPHCRGHLHPVIYSDVEVDVCPSCNGLWLDHGEEASLAQAGLGGDRWVRDLAGELGRRVEDTEMRCPGCGELLITYLFPQFEDLEVDLCELCGGLWLERGELAQVQRSRAAVVLRSLRRKRDNCSPAGRVGGQNK
jgi:serine/threonine protein kinase